MAIKDIYNSVSKGVGKMTGPISDIFQPKEYFYQAKQPTFTPVVSPNKYTLKDRGVDFTDEDFKAMRPLIYGEISNRNREKKELEANVILNTIINRARAYKERGMNKSLAEIVAMPNQYQAYGGKQYQAYYNPPDQVSLAKKKEVDAILDAIEQQIRSGQYADNTEGASYYIHNPDQSITYDNKRKLFK